MATVEELEAQIAELRREHREERRRIVTIAKEKAADHGLCEVVDRALQEAGLLNGSDASRVKISVEMCVDTDFLSEDEKANVGVDAGALNTAMQQVLAATGRLGVNAPLGIITGVSYGTVKRDTPRIVITDAQVISVEDAEEPLTGPVAPETYVIHGRPYMPRYTSSMGRKAHLVRQHANTVASLCGNYALGGWLADSNRAEWRTIRSQDTTQRLYCVECSTRASQYGFDLPT